MKRKALIISALIAVLCMGFINNASAHRWGWRHRCYRPHRVWIAPPPPPVVVVPPHPYYRHYYGPRYYGPRYYRPRYYRRW